MQQTSAVTAATAASALAPCALWVLSKNFNKYKGRMDGLGPSSEANGATSTAAPPAAEPPLFHTMVRGTTAATFLDADAARSTATTPSCPIVLLLDNDCADAGDIIQELFRRDDGLRQRVKWIHTLSTGVDLFKFHRYKDVIGAIPISNARGVFASILAEHVVCAMLYFNRQLWRLQANREHKAYDRFSMLPLRGQKLGIVGYGNIAQACVAGLAGLGVEATGLRRTLPGGSAAVGTRDALGVRQVVGAEGLDEILTASDVVLNVLPATDDNHHLFNAAVFKRMKPTALYINIGRGMTQDEHDLADALRTGTIRGAAVDVFEVEPLPPSSPLWDLGDDKLLLSPHNADITDDVYVQTAEFFINAARDFLHKGELPNYLVDIHTKGY